ncbi:uncharacterized protein [Physcomitrium patens]|uniref:Ribosomal RNA large subunit methyltransferase K/L-like methyltransferase domain-containing protein n=1 Tax=Physcomitrium patens TaxID=3218 RepID=A0A2K1K2Y0_PHYPA|nr:THUMP domain-containing protein 3-like isoform X2 [Physcomitrium patens]PNR48127.1 hypothetical protein PHYPA_012600 [Physcomitrium patens]|eukprot:XP_024385667.1 THUMP domain-containing protein 3-like isoform X2 [Physcomitrella patens]
MAHYWASCAGGLQFALVKELENLEGTSIIPGIDTYGGVQFRTTSPLQKVAELRSADNVYAFLSHEKNIPVDKEVGVAFMQSLASKIDWGPVMQLHKQWQEAEETCSTSRTSDPLLTMNGITNTDQTCEVTQMSFRVTGNRICMNMKKHGYTSMDVAAAIGDGIHELHGWPADMRSYNVEVLAWIIDDELLLLLALIYSGNKKNTTNLQNSSKIDEPHSNHASEEQELGGEQANLTKKKGRVDRPSRADAQLYSRRPYRKALVHTSLKPSTAYGILQLADVQPGDIVLDPMCGCGTIPLEASDWLGSRIMGLGGDFINTAIEASRVNSVAGESAGPCDIVQWDASMLPLRTASVDRVICDMPFGNRCGNHKVREVLCPRVVKQVVRVLRPGSGVAVLMAQSKTMKEEIVVNQKAYLSLQQHFYVHMEGLKVDVFVVHRTTEAAPTQQIVKPSKKMVKRKRDGQFIKPSSPEIA